jgi:acetolactate synthase-1/2/3 large subunit
MLLPDTVGTGGDSHTRFPIGISFPTGSGLVAFAAATGTEYVELRSDQDLEGGIARALQAAAANRPVLVNVLIDYSKKTQFTVGTVQTNLKRFDTKNKLRIVGRALKRKFFG